MCTAAAPHKRAGNRSQLNHHQGRCPVLLGQTLLLSRISSSSSTREPGLFCSVGSANQGAPGNRDSLFYSFSWTQHGTDGDSMAAQAKGGRKRTRRGAIRSWPWDPHTTWTTSHPRQSNKMMYTCHLCHVRNQRIYHVPMEAISNMS